MDKVNIRIEGTNVSDYYILHDILKKKNIPSEIKEHEGNGNELGFGFEELIILLPLTYPILKQLTDAFASYLSYRSTTKKVRIVLERDNKKLKIESGDGKLPDIKVYEDFFK